MSKIRRQAGTAIVEFAIVFPVLLLIVLGVIQISLMFVAREVVEYSAYAAARAELVGEDPERAAETVCSAIAGPTFDHTLGQPLKVPGWGELPRSQASVVKTSVKVIDGIENSDGTVTVEVTHLYEMVVPVASMLFKPISRPLEPGDMPQDLQDLFVTIEGAPHFVIKCRYTRPVPWDKEMENAQGHPVIPDL